MKALDTDGWPWGLIVETAAASGGLFGMLQVFSERQDLAILTALAVGMMVGRTWTRWIAHVAKGGRDGMA